MKVVQAKIGFVDELFFIIPCITIIPKQKLATIGLFNLQINIWISEG